MLPNFFICILSFFAPSLLLLSVFEFKLDFGLDRGNGSQQEKCANEYRVLALAADERNIYLTWKTSQVHFFAAYRVQSWSAQKKNLPLFFRNPSTFAIIIHNFSLSRSLDSWNVGSTKTRKKILCKICKSSRSSPHSKAISFFIHFLITNIFFSELRTNSPARVYLSSMKEDFFSLHFFHFFHIFHGPMGGREILIMNSSWMRQQKRKRIVVWAKSYALDSSSHRSSSKLPPHRESSSVASKVWRKNLQFTTQKINV